MTNPNDPWARRPDDDPTERLGQPGGSATEKPPAGDGPVDGNEPTTAYPGYDPYGGWGQPGPNPTREMPTYDSYAPGGRWDAPPPQDPYGGAGGPTEPPRPPNNNGKWVGIGLVVIVLVGLAGIGAGLLFGGGGGSQSTASEDTTSRTFGGGFPVEPEQSLPPLPTMPGFPEMPDSGGPEAAGDTTMGTISANTGGTLTVSTLTGEQVTVHTSAATQVISLAGATVDALPDGDLVIVQGQRAPDGSVEAEVIISTALEGGGR